MQETTLDIAEEYIFEAIWNIALHMLAHIIITFQTIQPTNTHCDFSQSIYGLSPLLLKSQKRKSIFNRKT